jgi:hypothetical protein
MRSPGGSLVSPASRLAVRGGNDGDRAAGSGRKTIGRSLVAMVLAGRWVIPKGWEKCSQRTAKAHGNHHIARKLAGQRACSLARRWGRGPMNAHGNEGAPAETSPVEFAETVVAHLREEKAAVETTLDQVCTIIERFGTFV